MATVKFTGPIEIEVVNKVDNAYRDRINAISNQMEASVTAEDILEVYIKATGGMELYEQTKHWLGVSDYISIGYYGETHLGISRRFKAVEVQVPVGISKAMRSMNPCFDALFAPYIELKASKELLEKECKETRRGIVDTFNSYPSVNAAVKANPELEFMLSQSTKDRMAEKIERVKRDAPVVSVNMQAVKSIALINRMNGA